jgi:RNA polymerase sigma factor (TIGR02999 family)
MAAEAAITQLLARVRCGEPEASRELIQAVYGELRALARRQLARERSGHTLQPTALVHEAWLRLGPTAERTDWQGRAHFFGAAAEAMRRILIEHARGKARLKRGGDARRVTLGQAEAGVEASPEDLLALDRALAGLERQDAPMAAVVKLRYFAGLTVEETASALGIAPRSVNRLWTAARAWLLRELGGPGG